MLQDCPRHHGGQAGRGCAAAKRATAGPRSGRRQDAPVDQHAPDFRVDARSLVCADSRRGDGIDGIRLCQRPDAGRGPRRGCGSSGGGISTLIRRRSGNAWRLERGARAAGRSATTNALSLPTSRRPHSWPARRIWRNIAALASAPCNRRRCDRDRAGLSACSRRTGGRRMTRPKMTSGSSTCSPGRPRI